MMLFRTQMLQEAPRHVAGPYTRAYARRYGRGDAARAPPEPAPELVPLPRTGLDPEPASTRRAGHELSRAMSGFDIAA